MSDYLALFAVSHLAHDDAKYEKEEGAQKNDEACSTHEVIVDGVVKLVPACSENRQPGSGWRFWRLRKPAQWVMQTCITAWYMTKKIQDFFQKSIDAKNQSKMRP